MSPSTQIAVVGAGLMGHGIAQVFAETGHDVRIYDPNPTILDSALKQVRANLLALGRDAGAAAQIRPCGGLPDTVAHAFVVFEAGPERLEVKQAIFAELEQFAAPEAILATNTSAIPIGEIGSRLRSKHRLVGTHWWNPPYRCLLSRSYLPPTPTLRPLPAFGDAGSARTPDAGRALLRERDRRLTSSAHPGRGSCVPRPFLPVLVAS
jgi:hypothetical protein